MKLWIYCVKGFKFLELNFFSSLGTPRVKERARSRRARRRDKRKVWKEKEQRRVVMCIAVYCC